MNVKLSRWIHRHRWLTALWLLVLVAGVLPALLETGYSSWETRRDSRFYARCAEDFRTEGRFKWSEIYPVALQKGKPADMAWIAVGHPLLVAALQSLGLGTQQAAVWASALAYLSILSLVCLLATAVHGDTRAGFLWGALALALGASWDFAMSGGTESLSQAFLVAGLWLAWRHLRWPSTGSMAALLALGAAGWFVRPHNQIFYLALAGLSLVGGRRQGLNFFLAWLAGLLLVQWLQYALTAQGAITFPYLFSFLVGTPAHPGHEIFREYHGGFGLAQLLAQKDQLQAKLPVALALLKQYWTGWLPQLLILCACSAWGRARVLSRLLLVVLLASIFLSALGHLVPRYWTMVEVATLVVLACALAPEGKIREGWNWAMFTVGLVVILFVARERFRFWPPESKLHIHPVPADVMAALPPEGLLACDDPAAMVDGVPRVYLRLPQTLDELDRINVEVEKVQALVLTPGLESGECAFWSGLAEALPGMGYRRVLDEGGWCVYRAFTAPPTVGPAR